MITIKQQHELREQMKTDYKLLIRVTKFIKGV